MKPWDFEKFSPLLEEVNPQTICEIGTHKGNTAVQMIMFLAPKVESLYYTGYDVFDFASGNLEFNRREYNGKGGVPMKVAQTKMENLKKIHSNFDYRLYKGFTKTLLEKGSFDFVYIDGGHSYDTVKFDYEQVKDSKIVVFDDAKNKNAKGVLTFMDELLSIGTEIEFQDRWGIIRNYA